MTDKWIERYDAQIKKGTEYVATFHQLAHYYYEMMSDDSRPSVEYLDKYEVTVVAYRREGRWLIANHLCDRCRTGTISKDLANKVWWNLKTKDITFADCKRIFATIAGEELD